MAVVMRQLRAMENAVGIREEGKGVSQGRDIAPAGVSPATAPMIDDKLLGILCCPLTHLALREASPEEINLNRKMGAVGCR